MQLKRELGVSYKTAWRMVHKIRSAMAKREVGETFEAIVEIDETYVGIKTLTLLLKLIFTITLKLLQKMV